MASSRPTPLDFQRCIFSVAGWRTGQQRRHGDAQTRGEQLPAERLDRGRDAVDEIRVGEDDVAASVEGHGAKSRCLAHGREVEATALRGHRGYGPRGRWRSAGSPLFPKFRFGNTLLYPQRNKRRQYPDKKDESPRCSLQHHTRDHCS